jgi:hypothetical protein
MVTMTLAVAGGCSLASPSDDPSADSPDIGSSGDCAATYRAWVDGAASLNSPGVDVVDVLIAGERLERQVFESCTLEEAERFNREMPVEWAPGFSEPMIEPDFRTFAEVECVDESPLLDGTPLCGEVGH